ncbi:MAG: imidazole glycerol phosphate synthase subunit HisH [Terriglobia bacterium]
MIAVVDYGGGNIGSVLKATEHLGHPAERVARPELLRQAEKIILPGQGHFGAMMAALSERGILEALREALAAGTPFLGICLGLEALYEASDEAPDVPGLGFLPGRVRRFKGIFKVPHVGWSQLQRARESRILQGVEPGSFVYFCHSYFGPVTEESVGLTEYGECFAAAAEMKNIFAVQFHPEKSGEVGLRVLKNFLEDRG